MCGRFLLRLVAEESRYATPVGRLLLPVLLCFRLTLLAASGTGVYGDEQSEFVCHTQQPGCKAACYDAFHPLSPLRFWAFQVLLVAVPSALYMGFTLYHVIWRWEEPEKAKKGETLVLEGEGSREPLEAGSPRLLWAYMAQLGVRLVLEGAALAGQYHLFGFKVPSSVACRREPCLGSITCNLSRPMEKSIFLKTMFAVSGFCLSLTLLELVLLGLGRWWRNWKHKFSFSNFFPASKHTRRHKEARGSLPVVEQFPEADDKGANCPVTNAVSSELFTLRAEKGEMWQRNKTSQADFILEGLFDDSLTHVFLFSLTILVFLVAVSGNVLTILLICADPRLHTPMYFLLSQLSLMDLMHVSTTIPKMATNYLSGEKAISFVSCATQHFFYLAMGGAECLLLTLMSYDRYVAICHPLRYTILMNRKVTLMMAVISWLGASMNSLIHTMILMHFPFCGSRKIHHFYCEFPAVVKLVCGDITMYEKTVYISTVLLLLFPILLVATSYTFIIHSVIQMRSAGSKRNAFATCSSHLTVVCLFFGACIFSYMRPRSQRTPLQDKVGSVFYSIITPTLNPLIYTLRNKDVAKAVRRVLGRDSITQ
ncbi:Olfactory receptor 2AE1, partial [Galemys pyrenaicus]